MKCKCGEVQYSPMDKKYLEIFGICWYCDKERWEEGELSEKEFEIKEQHALDKSLEVETSV